MRRQSKLIPPSLTLLAFVFFAFLPATGTAQDSSAAGEAGQTRTTLPNGLVLVLGGTKNGAALNEARLHNPKTGHMRTLVGGMQKARAHHTATVLPDGRVLIFGGSGNGQAVTEAEIYNPSTEQFAARAELNLTTRSGHTANLLLDGRLLVVGGLGADGALLDHAETWDWRTGASLVAGRGSFLVRQGSAARLLPDGSVLIYGGRGRSGEPVTSGSAFNPDANTFTEQSAPDVAQQLQAADQAALQLIASLPPSQATDVSPESAIALRFSTRVDPTTVTTASVTLFGTEGETKIGVTPAEEGMLAFIVPAAPLMPGARYTLFLDGVTSASGQSLGFEALSFTVKSLAAGSAAGEGGRGGSSSGAAASGSPKAPATGRGAGASDMDPDDDESFSPNASHHGGHWRTGKRLPDITRALLDNHERFNKRIKARKARAAKRGELQAEAAWAAGETGVAGVVLRLNDRPLSGVTVSIGSSSTRTDHDGRFALTGVPAGHHELIVDGTTAGGARREYVQFVLGVDIKDGEVASLPHAIYLPRVRAKDWVDIASPVQIPTVITHPEAPGLEIHFPKGAVIRDRAGNILTRFALVPVPLDRAPFPTPGNFPVYFMMHPGGATIHGLDPKTSPGVRIVYPNYTGDAPGTAAQFWIYDPRERGWFVYGNAAVSADGKQILAESNVGLFEYMAFSVTTLSSPPAPEPPIPPGGCPDGGNNSAAQAGDPVDCRTGVFLHRRTDVVLPDVMPFQLTRTYRPGDTQVRPFGKGTTHNYSMYLLGSLASPTLVLPDGSRIGYSSQQHQTSPGPFFGSRLELLLSGASFGFGGNVHRLTLKDGTVHFFQYTSGNPLIATIDRFGNRTDFTYSGGLLQRAITQSGRYVDFLYDASNRISEIRDLNDRRWTYTYHPSGELARATAPDSTFEEYTYDSAGRMLTVRDRRGNTMVTNVYDANGRVQQQTLADGGIYQFAYGASSTDVTDPRGAVRRYTFHASGYPLSITDAVGTPLERVTTYERSGSGHATAVIDTLNRRTAYTHDAKGNVTQVVRLAGTAEAVTQTFTYEPTFNQLKTYTDPLGNVTTLNYDERGSLTEIIDPLTNRIRVTPNAAGQPIAVANGANQVTELEYDLGDLVAIHDPLARTTRRQIDNLGRLVALTDPAGIQTRYNYDALDRLTEIVDAHGNFTLLAYDGNGNLRSVTDARGGRTQYVYDPKNRLANRIDPLDQSEAYAYDGNDNLTTFTDRKAQATTYIYDVHNRRTDAAFADGSTITYTYDAASRFIEATDSLSGTITRTYDGIDRLVNEATPQGSVAYGYDGASRRTSMTVQGQPSVTYGYDIASRLTSITQDTANVAFTYDAASRRTSLTLPNGIIAEYTYDAASQLTGITYRQGATVIGDLVYGYDARGQRTTVSGSLARTALPPALTSTTHDAANRLTVSDGTTLTYDANGNITNDGTRTYTWDARNRLASLAGPVAASFQYDAFGRRMAKTIGGSTTNYLYDGANPVQEQNGSNSANLLTGLNIDEFFRRIDAQGPRDFLTDALGSVLALTDSAGAIRTSYTYEAYGITSVSGDTSTNPFQYTGRENDGTGLYYYRARYYAPGLGRFVSEDSIGLAAGPNLYAYVLGDPANHTDPEGNVPLVALIPLIGGGIGALASAIDAADQCNATWGDILAAAGRGFASGAVGSLVGLGIGAATGNPYLAGAGGGLAGNLTNQILSGGEIDPVYAGIATITGVGGSVAGKAALPLVGRAPSLTAPRDLSNLGPNSQRLLGQKGVSGAIGGAVGAAYKKETRGGQCGC